MANLNAVFNWAMREEWLDRNPAIGLVESGMDSVRRRGFTSDEREKIFGGLTDERKANSWKWWIPTIALWTGARANEIGQLRRSDIMVENGVHYISISEFGSDGKRDSDKKLKTNASRRNVPLHKELIATGFLDYVAKVHDQRARLFQELRAGPNGGYSHDLSKWFGRHLDSLGLTDPSLVFHSFRHGFADACRNSGISSEMRKVIGGWSNPGVAESYGNAGSLHLLTIEMEKLRYD